MIKSHFFSNKFVDLTIFWNINRRMILGTSWGNLLENVQKNILHNVLNLDKIENFGNIEKPKKKLEHFWGKSLEIQFINENSTWRI
jgi:hypothetical protein